MGGHSSNVLSLSCLFLNHFYGVDPRVEDFLLVMMRIGMYYRTCLVVTYV